MQKYGEDISDAIEGFFDTVEWDTVGQTISAGVSGVLETMVTFIETFDASKISNAFGTLFANINWGDIFGKILELLVTFGVRNVLGGRLIDWIEQGISTLSSKISEFINQKGENIGQKFLEGLKNAFINVNSFVIDNIIVPILNGITSGFGIEGVNIPHGIGKQLMENIVSGIEEGIGKVAETWDRIKETILGKIEEIKSGTTEIFTKLWGMLLRGAQETVNNIIDGINKIISGINRVGDRLGIHLEELSKVKWADDYEKNMKKVEKTTENSAQSITVGFEKIKQAAKTNMDLSYEANAWGTNTINGYNEGIESQEEETNNTFIKIRGMLDENMNQAANATEYGWQTVSGYDKGLDNGSTTLMGTFAKIKQVVGSSFNQTQTAYSLGSQTAERYNRGIEDNSGTGEIYNTLNNRIHNIFNFKDRAYWWGRDLINGFNEGLNASKHLLTNTTETIAKIISHYLHFSRPDEGPLRDYETWMPDMMKGLSDSLVQAAPILDVAVNKISEMLAESLSNIELPNVEQSLFVNQNASSVIGNIGNKTNNAAKDNVTSNMIRATYEAVSKALTDTKGTSEGQPIVVNIGNKELYRGYGQYQDEQSNMLGVNVN